MLHTVTFRAVAIATCGWLCALDAGALTMGTVRGGVFLGRPLDLTIAATLDTAETDPCASADLFHGQQRVTPPAVRWESRDGREGVLRVTSELLVDEPMVTVFLRVGCGQPSSRRYVLLAAVPPEEAPGSARRAAAAPVTIVPPAAAASTPAAPATPQPRRSAPAAAKAPASAPAAAAPAVVPRPPAAAPPAVEAAREPARSVLKLEPGDLSTDAFPGLRLSTEIGTQPTADPAARQAAAALWQALQKGPEEAMQEALRLQALQRQLQSVRDVERQHAVDVAEMRAEMERAQSQRSTASLLAAVLAGLLAAVLAALAWRWYRIRRVERVGRWFEANGQATALPSAAAAARAPVLDNVLATPPTAVGIEGTEPVAARPAAPAAPVVPWSPSQLDFQASRGAAIRMVGVEELMDVHDKADFFMSIGDVDEAVAVLEGHVHDQVETSALPWLDLLGLYHSLGRRADFERLRAEFRDHFAAQVPDFQHFDQPTPTLENYGRALSRIVELWPTRRVLDVIEESLFRQPGLAGAEAFSLEAYRELALLYHIATDVSPAEDISFDARHPTAFGATSMQPLQTLDAPERPAPDAELLMVPPSGNVGVDVDITAVDDAPDTLPPVDFHLDLQDEAPDPGRGHA